MSAVWDNFAFRVTYNDGGKRIVHKCATVYKHWANLIRIRGNLLIQRVILVTATQHVSSSAETSSHLPFAAQGGVDWVDTLDWSRGITCIQNLSASLLSASIVGHGGSSFATIVLRVPLVVCHVNISQRGIPLRSPFQKHSIPGLWLFQGASSTHSPPSSPPVPSLSVSSSPPFTDAHRPFLASDRWWLCPWDATGSVLASQGYRRGRKEPADLLVSPALLPQWLPPPLPLVSLPSWEE